MNFNNLLVFGISFLIRAIAYIVKKGNLLRRPPVYYDSGAFRILYLSAPIFFTAFTINQINLEKQSMVNLNLYAWDESEKTNSVRIRFLVIERKDQDAVSRTEMRMIC